MGAGSATSFLSARFLLPDYLVRGEINALSCPLWQDGALVAPTSGTATVYDGSNTSISTGAVIVTASIATYSVSAAEVPSTLSPGTGWRVEWELLVATLEHKFRNTAALVLSDLYPPATDADLFRRVSGLDPSGSSPMHSLSDLQDFLDEAWVIIVGLLINKGNLPFLIVEPTALRESQVTLALALIFEDFTTRLSEKHRETAAMYRERFEAAWSVLRFEYDDAHQGRSGSRRKISAAGSVWMTSRG